MPAIIAHVRSMAPRTPNYAL